MPEPSTENKEFTKNEIKNSIFTQPVHPQLIRFKSCGFQQPENRNAIECE
jgi:hypothetical protein